MSSTIVDTIVDTIVLLYYQPQNNVSDWYQRKKLTASERKLYSSLTIENLLVLVSVFGFVGNAIFALRRAFCCSTVDKGTMLYVYCGGPAEDHFRKSTVEQIRGATVGEENDLAFCSIPSKVFNVCPHLHTVRLGAASHITSIDEDAFFCSELLEIVELPPRLVYLGRGAFAGCTSLKTISLPRTVKTVGSSCFEGCEELKQVDIPPDSQLECIGQYTFAHCAIVSMNLPHTVKRMGAQSFYLCMALQDIRLPEGMTVIEKQTFSGCSSLEEVLLPNSIHTIESKAFVDCRNLCRITIPRRVSSLGSGIFSGCKKLQSIEIPPKITRIPDDAFRLCQELSVVEMQDCHQLKSIGRDAYYMCASLREIRFPPGLETIGGSTFMACLELKSIHLPRSLRCMEKAAFADCAAVQVVQLPQEAHLLRSLGRDTFYGCTSLKYVGLPGLPLHIWPCLFRELLVEEQQQGTFHTNGLKRAGLGLKIRQTILWVFLRENVGHYLDGGAQDQYSYHQNFDHDQAATVGGRPHGATHSQTLNQQTVDRCTDWRFRYWCPSEKN